MKLRTALACEDARARPDGRLDIQGALIELYAPGFPAMQDRMTVVFVMEWERGETGRIPFRIDMVDEAERPVLTIQGHTDVEAAPAGAPQARTQLIMPLEEVKFPRAGYYHFHLRAGASEQRAFSLYLGEYRES